MLLKIFLVAPFLILFLMPHTAQAEQCNARVVHAGNVIQGKKIYTHFTVGHSPWRWATVSFRYKLTYVDEDNEEGTIEGRFRDIITAGDEEYVKLKNVRRLPSHVSRTTISDISCER